ncbi:MerR family transcriptional regulator [Saccharothrix sp. S26]|uniref:MerR family transcriptional regulator n=1 Tax=Saccharothrix sp. S26 TaxID=2907215 RepID=UPI001F1B8737|nr:MerR family transcriptional regulator [Saccharothrix sp. S26]MCE6995333.1 MerR family transcriptional regulator [Saccharothrix sp. S26]
MTGELPPIAQVAKASGVASSALRYYEHVGLLEEDPKICGKRHYPHDVLDRRSMIRTCRNIGFSPTEISSLLDEAEESGGLLAGDRRSRPHRAGDRGAPGGAEDAELDAGVRLPAVGQVPARGRLPADVRVRLATDRPVPLPPFR